MSSTPRHIRVIWSLERISGSFYNPYSWGNKVFAFTRDVVEGMLYPTVLVDEAWWTLQDRELVLEADDSTVLITLRPSATEVKKF